MVMMDGCLEANAKRSGALKIFGAASKMAIVFTWGTGTGFGVEME